MEYPISEMVEFAAYRVDDEFGDDVVVVRKVGGDVYKVMNIPDTGGDEKGIDTIDPYFYAEDAVWYVEGKRAVVKLLNDLGVDEETRATKVLLFDEVRRINVRD